MVKDNLLKIEKLNKSHFGRYECSFIRDNIRHLAYFYLTEDILNIKHKIEEKLAADTTKGPQAPFNAEISIKGGKYEGFIELICRSSN
jgi:hypothetical protein